MKMSLPFNFLSDTLYKSLTITRRSQILVALVAIIIAGGGFISFRASLNHRHSAEQARQASIEQEKRLEQEQIRNKETLNKQSERANPGSPGSNSVASTSKTPVSKHGADQRIKYSTSSDPRSTAFSYTPPAPNPASFTTKITHSGQIAAGTLIEYNATKGERTYYGGDLILSRPSMTISRSNPSKSHLMPGVNDVTISAPNGAVIGMASLPWDEPSQYFAIARDSSKSATGTAVEMFVAMFGTPPLGTTTLHIISGPVSQPTDGWRNDGFIIINVVE